MFTANVFIVGWRARQARMELRRLRENDMATKIQKIWRGHRSRGLYAKERRQIILVQSVVRRRAAKKELKKLKLEARSVSMFKEKANMLERKVGTRSTCFVLSDC